MSVKHHIYDRLHAALSPSQLEIRDTSHHHAGHREAGDAVESHFDITIQSTALDGLTRVKQHQAIYRALDGLMPRPIHAIAISVIPAAPGAE
ncbi:MAG: BolA family transcriptional regulator [Sphaerospermopsis sp. SIO1G2]|nr:BolA family transcriptional regulator [Sphaerospermopsis sp. SIO1G2]